MDEEKKELEELEAHISELEQRKNELMDNLNRGAGNHEDLMQWSKDIENVTASLDEKEMRWLELSELS